MGIGVSTYTVIVLITTAVIIVGNLETKVDVVKRFDFIMNSLVCVCVYYMYLHIY